MKYWTNCGRWKNSRLKSIIRRRAPIALTLRHTPKSNNQKEKKNPPYGNWKLNWKSKSNALTIKLLCLISINLLNLSCILFHRFYDLGTAEVYQRIDNGFVRQAGTRSSSSGNEWVAASPWQGQKLKIEIEDNHHKPPRVGDSGVCMPSKYCSRKSKGLFRRMSLRKSNLSSFLSFTTHHTDGIGTDPVMPWTSSSLQHSLSTAFPVAFPVAPENNNNNNNSK